jgi:hypothetical protein
MGGGPASRRGGIESNERAILASAPIVFSALLSAIMVGIVSGFVLVTSQGFHAGLAGQCVKSCLTTWPVAFPTVAVVAPWVRRVVGRVTA